MSWLFSRVLVEACLPRKCLDSEQFALSSWIGTADAFLHSDKMMDALEPHSRYGMTFVPLTADRGEALLMSSLEDFLVRLTAAPQQEKTRQMIFGRKCVESWQMSLPGASLPKTSAELQSTKPQTTLSRWVTKPKQFSLVRQTWVQITYGKDIGYLHTPTTKANYCANSMQKWASCRAWKQVFGRATPEIHEYLMGWPTGWSDIKPLATDKFQQWQQQHLHYSLQGETDD